VSSVTNSPSPSLPTPRGAVAGKRILVAIDDLFFLARIQETARQLGVGVEFAKTDVDILAKVGTGDAPALIIFDLNSASSKPLTTIAKLRANPALKKTSVVGYVSHVQGELKLKAQEAGCSVVMPRSAFSQTLAQLLRRHGLPEE